MNSSRILTAIFAFWLCFDWLPSRCAHAEDVLPQDRAVPSNGSIPSLTQGDVESALADLDAAAGIADTEKETLRNTYSQVSDIQQQAENFANQAEGFIEDLERAPQRTSDNLSQLDELPSTEVLGKVDAKGDSTAIRKQADAQQATLLGLSKELQIVETELLRIQGRPVEIGERLPSAQRELSTIRAQWETTGVGKDPPSPAAKA